MYSIVLLEKNGGKVSALQSVEVLPRRIVREKSQLLIKTLMRLGQALLS